jgi:hypothetical protein
MSDFEQRIPEDDHMIEDWPDPDDGFVADHEEDWDDYYNDEDDDTLPNYNVSFRLSGATPEQVDAINRYLFDAISKELGIQHEQLEYLEIEED